MPYPNEHACRLREPGEFQADSFKRSSRKHKGKTYDVISGKLKGEDTMTEQAYRYPKDTWTANQARSHCEDHEGIRFEPAAEDNAGKGEIERRVIGPALGEIRVAEEDGPKLTGYAAKYGVWTDLGWFKEKIKAGAFDEVLKTSDARALKNHDPNLLLGRESSGTLRLASNSVGLKFEIDVPDTTTGQDALEEVRRGDLAGCSFSFTIPEDGTEWVEKAGQLPERTILRVDRLFDVGPVTFPAYEETTVIARSVEALRAGVEKPAISPDATLPKNRETAPGPGPMEENPEEKQRESKPASAAEVARLRREIEIIRHHSGSPEA
jgi:HK97 family phage prohead protease